MNKDMTILALPYPPSVNSYWLSRGNRRYISKRGQLFKKAVYHYVLENNIQKFGDKPLEVSICIHPRSKVLMDLDNSVKAILDSCQDAGLFDDDVQVQALHVFRTDPVKGGGCSVIIEEFHPV